MMEEEIRTSLGSALRDLVAEDLALMSLDDLSLRVEVLQAEIERALAMIESKKGSHSDAEALFK
jgi:uncharacterized small protein (DUF1192 family)